MSLKTGAGTDQARLPLRLWLGVAIVSALWLTRLGASFVGVGAATEFMVRVLGGMIGTLAVMIWWLAFSRVPWSERAGALVLMITALAATWVFGDPSILVWLVWYAGPILSLALVAGALAGRGLTSRSRRLVMAGAIVLPCVASMVVRIAGVAGHGVADFEWRWTTTPEQRLLARAGEEPVNVRNAPAPLLAPASEAPATPAIAVTAATTPPAAAVATIRWAGFRGADRSGRVPGLLIETDWSAAPPAELWRRPVGPGWSSFAVRGDVLYTQEQRGGEEIVSAYRVSTGEPVWRHRDRARFDDPMGGPGPRSTPALAFDRVYAFGPTGILNALDATTGTVVWSRDAATDAKAAIPVWGFAGSPLIVDDLVMVGVGGTLAA